MNIKGRSRGFTMVELLTVIAIIAILAAIIFPVMGTVKDKARENQCITQLQQVGVAMGLFKQDNRRYPDVLGSEALVQSSGTLAPAVNPDTGDVTSGWVQFESAKDKYLFPEYVKSYITYHCAKSQVSNTKDIAVFRDLQGKWRGVYAYDCYDVFVTGAASSNGEFEGTQVQQRYAAKWAASVGDVAAGGRLPYPPTGTTDTSEIQQEDFSRQLAFKKSAGRYCSYLVQLPRGTKRQWQKPGALP